MRVAVFGAAGQLGRRVILRLVKQGGCSAILAADRDARGLSDLHARFDAHGITIRYLEAGDPRSVGERASGMDAVISCLGGSGSDELAPALAAIESGAVFLSSSEDPVLHRGLKEAGGRYREGPGMAVAGLGWSPGLTNLLAIRAAEGFERLDSLDISWVIAAPDLRSPGGQERMLRCFRGRCDSFEQGRLKEVRAGSWEEWRSFPPEVGWSNVTYSCQPEPLTLPGRLPGVLRVQVKGGLNLSTQPYVVHTLAWFSAYLPEHLQELVNHGMGLALKRLHRPGETPRVSGLRVEASGIREGRRAGMAYGATGGYLDATAGMLVAALGLMRDDGGRGRGVVALEEALELRDLLPALRGEGVRFWSRDTGDGAISRDNPVI